MEHRCGFDIRIGIFSVMVVPIFCLYPVFAVPLFFEMDTIFSTSEAQWRRRSNATALAQNPGWVLCKGAWGKFFPQRAACDGLPHALLARLAKTLKKPNPAAAKPLHFSR